MNLKEQTYVTVLAKYGSLTRAAEALFLAPASLSEYITKLEKQLGTPLFTRSNKKFLLTQAGSLYVETATKMLSLNNNFETKLHGLLAGDSGTIRLGVQLRRGTWILPRLLSAFYEKYPHMEIEVYEGTNFTLMSALTESRVDLVMVSSSEQLPGLTYEPIFTEDVLVALAPKHPLCAKAKPSSPYPSLRFKDLEQEIFILGQEHQGIRRMADSMLQRAHITPKKIIEIRNIDTGVQMAAAGLGIAFTRATYAKHSPKEALPVNFYKLEDISSVETTSAVWRNTTLLTPPLKELIALMHELKL